MKTLILYASKYGAACGIARRIANKIDGAVTHDLKQKNFLEIADFDCVIIGGSVYAGMVRKEVKTFIAQNAGAFRGKKIGLFLSGMDTDESKQKACFDANFPADFLQTVKAKGFLGGIFDPKKAGALERFIFKLVTKRSEYTDNINNERISLFAEEMKA
jgi:menaquinone-dependent protoporphyrinogen oxidase